MSIKIMSLLQEKYCGDTVLIGIYQSSGHQHCWMLYYLSCHNSLRFALLGVLRCLLLISLIVKSGNPHFQVTNVSLLIHLPCHYSCRPLHSKKHLAVLQLK